MSSETFGNFLKRKFHEWRGRELPSMKSQAEFAVFLGVPTTNLSTWMSDQKKPGPDYVDVIADKMAREQLAKRSEVYAAAGVPPRMPGDRRFSLIAVLWDMMTDEERNEWYEKAIDRVNEREGEANHNNQHAAA